MQYKGDDLDLRVTRARAVRETYVPDYDPAPANGRWPRPRPAAHTAGEPLWVDEVLLACCNLAFDVAQANGAAEVGLEHLVNALTRIDAAARILEARGVHEGQLRRESAALIASEIPATGINDAVTPRRASELEDVLRLASDLAHRRGYAAGVDDVLWVLLHHARDLPAVLLLRRLTPDWQRADWGRPRDVAPEPPAPPARSMQLVAMDGLGARVAGLEDTLRAMQSDLVNERKLLVDLVRDIQRDVIAQRGDGAAFRGDLGQRLEMLERTVQARNEASRVPAQLAERMVSLEKTLQAGLSESSRATSQLAERLSSVEGRVADERVASGQKALAERLTALEQTISSGVADSSRASGQLAQRLASLETTVSEGLPAVAPTALVERMATLEKAVHGGLGEGARNWAHMGSRLASLESALGQRSSETLSVIGERMTALELSLESLTEQRLGTMEQLLASARNEGLPEAVVRLPETMAERLAAFERRLAEATAESGRQARSFGEQLGALTRWSEITVSEGNRARLEIAERFDDVEQRLSSGPTEPAAELQQIVQRVAGLERAVRSGFGEATTGQDRLGERLALIERTMAAPQTQDASEAVLILDDRLGAIERMLDTRASETASATHQIVERLRLIESRPATAAIDPVSILSPLRARLDGIEAASGGKIDTIASAITELTSRIAQLETQVKADAVVNEEALRGRDQDFDFIYSEIKQLGQSQATLNSAVHDWRNESQTHFGTVTKRLEKLQAQLPGPAEAQPPKAMNGVEADVTIRPSAAVPAGTAVRDTAAERPATPTSGFRRWLFGTDRLRQTHRDTDINLARMRDGMREARERRREILRPARPAPQGGDGLA
jgi:CII-binding regulator of phage lambda lysogenization HflD